MAHHIAQLLQFFLDYKFPRHRQDYKERMHIFCIEYAQVIYGRYAEAIAPLLKEDSRPEEPDG
jgi:hypothetical protein